MYRVLKINFQWSRPNTNTDGSSTISYPIRCTSVYIALGTHYGSIDPNSDAGIGIYNFNTTSCTIVNGSYTIRNISCLFICR